MQPALDRQCNPYLRQKRKDYKAWHPGQTYREKAKAALALKQAFYGYFIQKGFNIVIAPTTALHQLDTVNATINNLTILSTQHMSFIQP